MDTITIRGKKYQARRILTSSLVTELPGFLGGGKILTSGKGGNLAVSELGRKEPILSIFCQEGWQEKEEVFPEARRYYSPLSARLEGLGAEGFLYIRPLDLASQVDKILETLEREFPAPWIQCHKFNLDTAKTDLLINEFPSRAGYVYVQECGGTVTLKFDSQNSPTFTLAAKDSFCWPVFQQLYLTWDAQAGKRLIFYVSNREIKRTTLA